MEKIIRDLKKMLKFKDRTNVGDIVLVVAKDPQMLAYALVTEITRDESKRDEWWFVTLQFLTIPLQKTTWILRTEQLTGQEIFTMDDKDRFVKAIDFELDKKPRPTGHDPHKKTKPTLRVIK